jgi:hypothetical protein
MEKFSYKRDRKAYMKNYHQKPKVKLKQKERSAENYKNWVEYISNYKKDKCCVECGYKEHTEILQFHHQKEKTINISQMMTSPLNKVSEEIEKCVLLCPNCHYLLHSRKQSPKE